MRRVVLVLAIAPFLSAMTCNLKPRPHPDVLQGLDQLRSSVDRLADREQATATMFDRAGRSIDKMADRVGALDQQMQAACPCSPVPSSTPALFQRESVK